ncbi:MAG: thrombospondin type 3 repeat-containing protein [Ignavibacteriae bacterium]|nr:thrombospondin type 3 repeat-containing protein [Ignavibacteriota bacterium]MCB9215455.1 thrombospondin type 3 repeat-containing protein [Ignavibacteria bacterium]
MRTSSTECLPTERLQATQFGSVKKKFQFWVLSSFLLYIGVSLFSSLSLYAQRNVGDTVVPVEVEQGELPPVTAQYTSSPKITHHYYTHTMLLTALSTLPAADTKLTVTPEPEQSFCAPHEVLEGRLYTQFVLGIDDYNFGETELLDDFVITVTLQGYASGAPVGSPYLCSMTLSTLHPEQICQFDVSDQLSSVEYFKVTTANYTYPANKFRVNGIGNNKAAIYQELLNALQLHVYYEEKISVSPYQKNTDPTKEDISSPIVLEISNPIGQNGDHSWFGVLDNPVTFAWDLPSSCTFDEYPSYQIQILRLFNRDPDRYPDAASTNEASIKETINWKHALTFETGPLHDENGVQTRALALTMAEGRGYYVWRVRPIGDRYPGGIANDRNWGKWSSAPKDGDEVVITGFGEDELSITGQGPISSTSPIRDAFFFFLQFDEAPPNNIPERNWAFSRIFTEGEEGTRIHEAMSYMTPLLRGRQSQVHMRSENKVLITESMYDLSGRATVSTLPAPMEWSGFSYQEGFASYGVMDFDSDANWRGANPAPTMAGVVADYYSNANTDLDVPDAQGFPFSRVRFQPDGRVTEIGGSGDVYRIGGKDQNLNEGKSRTGRVLYAQASEDELLAMFGDEAPAASSVRAIYRIDPNKVISAQYVSKTGQTLATALVKADANDHLNVELPNEAVYDESSETVVSGWSVDGTDRVYSTSFSILKSDASELVHLTYELDASVFEGCSNICETCHYKVAVKIFNAEDPSDVHYEDVQSLDGLIGELCPNLPDPLPHITIETLNDTTLNNYPNHLNLIDPFEEIGTYNVEFRIITDDVDPNDNFGRTYAEISEANYREAVSDEIHSDLMSEINGYLNDAKLSGQDGLYEWLWLFVNSDPNDDPAVDLEVEALPLAPTTLEDVSTFVVTSSNSESCWSISIPVLTCPDVLSDFDANDDGQITVGASGEIDFEAMLPDRWGGTGNYEYIDENGVATGRTFPVDAWEYFYYGGVHLPNQTPYTNGAGAFNALVQNMLNDANVNYTFEELYFAWVSIVEGYATFATTDQSGDPAKVDVQVNLIEKFLERVGKAYAGVSDCEYSSGSCTNGFIDKAYKYFEYTLGNTNNPDWACEDHLDDIYGAISGWGADPRDGDQTGEETPLSQSDDKKWEMLYRCVYAHGTEVDVSGMFENCECDWAANGVEVPSDVERNACVLALKDQVEGECRSVCELRADGFRGEALRVYHQQNIYVDNEENIPSGATTIPALELECVVQAMIDECEGNCQLTVTYEDPNDTDSPITEVGNSTEIENLQKVFSWKLALESGSGGCTAPLATLPLASNKTGRAKSLARLLNKKLQEYREETNDAYNGQYNANQLRQALIDITGVTPSCWDEYEYAVSYEPLTLAPIGAWSTQLGAGCCSDNIVPPNDDAIHSTPGIFDFGSSIRAEFVVDEGKLTDDDYGITLRTWCNRNGVEYMQEAELCGVVTLAPCTGSLCFEWKERIVPEDTRLKMPFTCEQILAMQLRAELGRRINQQVKALAIQHRIGYGLTCLNPRGIQESKLTLTQDRSLYHFTLYYYDRAGRLVRTVPPAGVNLVAAGPGGVRDRNTTPLHELVTTYEYNSFSQLMAKDSPDGGPTTFVYDAVGRIRLSQDAAQATQNKYSYTRYDHLSRVVEVGQCDAPAVSLEDAANDFSFPADPTDNPEQRTYTCYTDFEASPNVPQSAPSLSAKYIDGTSPQRYTLNRVAHVYTDDGVHTYYSYDPHGNVEWVQHDLPGLGLNYTRYEYDLISGNMLKLHYNEGWRDGFKHAWVYDKDNRLVEVKTSRDGILWESDARYTYYLHGPWRRVEYGEDRVQGRDYVYTIQGWLKGINHPSLEDKGYSMDPGKDGDQSSATNADVAYDAFSMMLEYFKGDFTRTDGTDPTPFNSTGSDPNLDAWHLHGTKNLYNGNITSWASNTQGVFDPANPMKYDGDLTGYRYTYDVLNRLRGGIFRVYSTTSNSFGPPSTPGEYNVAYTYDPNGNIQTLDRWGGSGQMDGLSYEYYPNEGQNRLRRVVDPTIADGAYTMDIDNQPLFVPSDPPDPANDYYVYDEIGNLVEDKAEGTAIEWSIYGKVLSVLKSNGDQLQYIYDALGKRVVKTVLDAQMNEKKKTFYSYDAGGKVLAIYSKDCSISNEPDPNDTDGDGVPNSTDNCPCAFNPQQFDSDADGPAAYGQPCPYPPAPNGGDACDTDAPPCLPPYTECDFDGDGIRDSHDNCPSIFNPGQEDENSNGIGDACECKNSIEWIVYGNGVEGRIGVVRPKDIVRAAVTGDILDLEPTPPGGPGANIYGKPVTRILSEKSYELNDHLGNVRVVISDVKIPTDELDENGLVVTAAQAGQAPYEAKLLAVNNYYPFGMLQPERHWSTEDHRYGFNGKEMDNDWNDGGVAGEGTGNVYDYGFRIYDPRLGRFMSVDPLSPSYPWYTPYQYASNTPILYIDIDGLEGGSTPLTTQIEPIERPKVEDKFSDYAKDGFKFPLGNGTEDYMRLFPWEVGSEKYGGSDGTAEGIPDKKRIPVAATNVVVGNPENHLPDNWKTLTDPIVLQFDVADKTYYARFRATHKRSYPGVPGKYVDNWNDVPADDDGKGEYFGTFEGYYTADGEEVGGNPDIWKKNNPLEMARDLVSSDEETMGQALGVIDLSVNAYGKLRSWSAPFTVPVSAFNLGFDIYLHGFQLVHAVDATMIYVGSRLGLGGFYVSIAWGLARVLGVVETPHDVTAAEIAAAYHIRFIQYKAQYGIQSTPIQRPTPSAPKYNYGPNSISPTK